MADLPANPSRDDLMKFISASNLEYATVAFADYQGVVRAKYVARAKLQSALERMSFPMMALALDPNDVPLFAPGVADLLSSFGNRPVRVLPETARLIPWEREGRNLFLLAEFADEWAKYCPRNVYRKVFERAQALGYLPNQAVEFEFTLFDETAESASGKGYRNLKVANPHSTYLSMVRQGIRAGFWNELMDICSSMRIPIESLHEEICGFMEAALMYGHGVEAADNAVLFKTFAKAMAQRRGMLISFMARWSNEIQGQGGHIHFCLVDSGGKALFYDASAPHGITPTMRYSIGGLQRLMSDFLLMFAPNINSYKRLVPGIFAPASAAWGIENRTCSIRAITGQPDSSRIECRTPGADANPYLSMAGVLAACLYGIEHKIEPAAPCEGNAYEAKVPEELLLPASFGEAIRRFKHSAEARDFFGDAFVDAYADTRSAQLAQFNSLVTDRELERFLESV